MSHRPWIASLVWSCLVLSGCAPRVLKERPGDWPETWRGRHVYNTPRAFIYAATADLAGEADRIAITLAVFAGCRTSSGPPGIRL